MELLTIILTVALILALLGTLVYLVISKENIASKIPSVIISFVLLISIGLPFISDYEDHNETIEYDDYILADNVESATGSVELVEVDGVKYIHARSVGYGSIVSNDGESINYVVKKADLDVWFLTGQSNSAYYNENLDTVSPVAPIGTAYYYGTESRPVDVGTVSDFTYDPNTDYNMYSMTNLDGSPHIGNIEQPFSAQYYEKTGNKIYIINGGIGGVWVTSFMPSTGNYYWYEKEIFQRGMDAIDQSNYNVNTVGMIWVQGESNSTMSVNAYCIAFKEFYQAISGDSNYVFNDKWDLDLVLISQVRDPDNTSNVTLAQQRLSAELPNVHIGTDVANTFSIANGLLSADGLHYTQLGDNLIGVALFDYYYSRIYN